MPLSNKINWGTGGIHGNCWFAAEDIAAGEQLWWPGPLSPHGMQKDVKLNEIHFLLTYLPFISLTKMSTSKFRI
jgi:hypothetical protein